MSKPMIQQPPEIDKDEMANRVYDFLLSEGLSLKEMWEVGDWFSKVAYLKYAEARQESSQ